MVCLPAFQILKSLEGKKDSFVRFAKNSAENPPEEKAVEKKVDAEIGREYVESLSKKMKAVVDASSELTFELVRQE